MIIRVEVVNGDEIAERIAKAVIARLDRIAPRRGGSEHYVREPGPEHGAVPRQNGPRFGGLADDGTLVDETGAAP